MKNKKYFPNEWPHWSLLLIALLILSPINTSSQGLVDYEWNNRIIFLVGESLESEAIQDQLELFRNRKEEMAERDLILFLANGTNVVSQEKNKVAINVEELRKAARIDSNFKGVLLLGKDGGCKLKKEFQIKPEEIFDLIDGMPMRQFEIKNKGSVI